jgi:hypothetical protein
MEHAGAQIAVEDDRADGADSATSAVRFKDDTDRLPRIGTINPHGRMRQMRGCVYLAVAGRGVGTLDCAPGDDWCGHGNLLTTRG